MKHRRAFLKVILGPGEIVASRTNATLYFDIVSLNRGRLLAGFTYRGVSAAIIMLTNVPARLYPTAARPPDGWLAG